MRRWTRLAAAALGVVILLSTEALAEEKGPAFAMAMSETQSDSVEAEDPDASSAAAADTAGKSYSTAFGTVVTEESTQYQKGTSLGTFQIVAYYGDGKTYSGTTPTENHTISADLTVLPLGTKVFIGNTVYTVEDKGSGVQGKMIDIYYNTREEAIGVTWDGAKTAEVFLAEKR